ncbi:MAG: hypothetical protein M1308_03945 [Actinobacteria bacterium]|nr:hypothetical protein [Actinomycetota bacterium]
MGLRERFLEVIINFNTNVTPPKWEFGYLGMTIDKWYKEGLPKRNYPHVPKKITTPTASLNNPAWNAVKGRLPKGINVDGGGIYFPANNFGLS